VAGGSGCPHSNTIFGCNILKPEVMVMDVLHNGKKNWHHRVGMMILVFPLKISVGCWKSNMLSSVQNYTQSTRQ